MIKLNAALGTCDTIYSQPGGDFIMQNYNGLNATLILNNLAGKLQAGQSFQVFSNFSSFNGVWNIFSPATPGPGLTWNTNLLNVTGLLRIGGPTGSPVITSSTLTQGTNFAMSGFNGTPNGTFYVIATTNLTVPLANWTVLSTNSFDQYGGFSFTNVIQPGLPEQFFSMEATQ